MPSPTEEILVSVDIEASGPMPPDYSMLSIGACLVDDVNHTFYAELQPISDRILEAAMAVVGIPFEHFQQQGQPPGQVMQDLADWLAKLPGPGRPVMVGFNAAFDWAFVNWYFHHFTGGNPFGIAPLDIKAYYMGLSGCCWLDTTARRIPAALMGDLRQTHHALDDARAQAQMFARMLAQK